jgi:hypothetical protein
MAKSLRSLLCGASWVALAIALPAVGSVPALAVQSPLAGVAGENANYPRSDRLRANYQEVGGAVQVVVPGSGMTAAVAGFGAAAQIQAGLPQGFTLGVGSTTRLGGETPPQAARPLAGSEATAEPATTRFVTLYPIAYQGIPLSKGSDYLAIVADDGRLLHTCTPASGACPRA